MAGRGLGCCCCSSSSTAATTAASSSSSAATLGAFNEDNARFLLLAGLILLYMLCGAAVFSALEQPSERQAQQKWQARLDNFSRRHNLTPAELRDFLCQYEVAYVAGIRANDLRPRWDFPGAFYFVSTVVSTIGHSCTHFIMRRLTK
ncbi:hypothetical protein JRQ81_001047 [Phrynocephalus forsythii]|uniref:Potassium channel subfamily K member 13 n=1 Tax=Phrynocephalus forsythii TaxID=171643 RepID=A0A9Q0Y726_9SAUR|nr:hypothetical protein JRQ81_001047 [Phrynocephalus forsythii]